MVPFSSSIWYHILLQYGTIFYRNMVPYSFTLSPISKINKAKRHLQNKPFSSSKRLLFTCGACIMRAGLAVDYGPAALWISQHFVLGRIYPHAGARCGLRGRLRCRFSSTLCSGAYIRMLTHAVDFPALRARAHMSACWRMLWISQHFVLGRICPDLWCGGWGVRCGGASHRGAVVHLGSISV